MTADDQGTAWDYAEGARRRLGVSSWLWDKWRRAGLIRCGVDEGPGGRCKRYPLDALAREVEAARAVDAGRPEGWIGEAEARRRFGVGVWLWSRWRREGALAFGRKFPSPGGGQTVRYPEAEVARLVEAHRQFPPPGMLTGGEAAARFEVSPFTWKQWVVQKKVTCGRRFAVPGGGTCYLYAEADLDRLMNELRGEGKAYWDPKNPGFYRIPDGHVGAGEAHRMFGVERTTWDRWEREGQIDFGTRVNAGAPKVYRLDDLHRLLADYGRYAPPYPDPDRPGVVRVPLSGHDIRRREALIDAADLSLVEGSTWNWGDEDDREGAGRVSRGRQGDTTSMHRVILGETDPSLTVMHLNDDPLDCRRANLVTRTFSERSGAARKPRSYMGRPCTSRFKGVCWDARRSKWLVQIKVLGVHRHIGRFDSELAAAQAYDEAAVEAWGGHSRVNFPGDFNESNPTHTGRAAA